MKNSRVLSIMATLVVSVLLVSIVATAGPASAVAPTATAKTVSTVAMTPMAITVSASSCHTNSYDYTKWNFLRLAKWKILNKCRTIALYNRTRHADSASVFADSFCALVASWSGPGAFIVGPLCIGAFRVDAKRSKASLKKAATTSHKCIGIAPWWDTDPYNRMAVYGCRYH